MHSHRSLARTVFGVVAFILRTGLTLLTAGILIAEANGYDIDFQTLRVSKLGLLAARVTPSSALPTLNGEVLTLDSGQWVVERPPGNYSFDVAAPEYQPWSQRVRIEAGRSTAFPALALFRRQPTALPVRSATASELAAPLVDPKLRVNGGELWLNRSTGPILISRFSQTIHSAVLLDPGHVILLISNTVHVIDIDGSNDRVLDLSAKDQGSRVLSRDSLDVGVLASTGQIQWSVVR